MAWLEDTLLDQAVPPVGRSILADLEFLYASKRGEAWWVRLDIVWCLSGGAWLYAKTQKGVMPSMLKDLVRLDPSTVQLWNGQRWTQVVAWSRSDAAGCDKLEIVFRSGERVGCLASHRWPTQRGVVDAAALEVGDIVPMARLPDSELKRTPYLTDDLLWLIGLYLAEGSRSEDTVQLSLAAKELDWLPRVNRATADVGATMAITLDEGSLHVRLYGRVLRSVLDEHVRGRVAADKHLSNAVWALPNDALRLILEGYLDGDGHDDGTRVRLGFTRNYELERDLRTAAARLGATLTLHPTVASYQGGKRPSMRGEWRFTRSGHPSEKDRGEIIEIRRSRARQFWDVSVADEPHLFSLASGLLTYNSKANPMPESVRDRPTSAHEHIFLLSKSPSYFYDAEAVRQQFEAHRTSASSRDRD